MGYHLHACKYQSVLLLYELMELLGWILPIYVANSA